MRLPIDLSNLTFIAGSDPAGVLDMERRPRADKATGGDIRAQKAAPCGKVALSRRALRPSGFRAWWRAPVPGPYRARR